MLDFSDQAVVPGLIDCHVHLAFSASVDPLADLLEEDDAALLLHAVANARTALAAGITTVRDLGDRGGQSFLNFEPELLTDVQKAAIAIRVELVQVFRRMLELGVKMVAGTDAGTRRSTLDRLPGEIELYVQQLGLTPVAAIATATGGAAEALGLSAEVGSVQPGRQADLTVVEGALSAYSG